MKTALWTLLLICFSSNLVGIDLEGVYLTLDQVESLKRGKPISSAIGSLRPLDKKELSTLSQNVQHEFLWHQSFPTVGLTYKEPSYPFIPHWFGLWDLAPHKGKGVTIAVLDTGVAAFAIENDPEFKKNINLNLSRQPLHHNFNIVSNAGLDPLEQYSSFLMSFIKKEDVNQEELERTLPIWIAGYLANQDERPFRNYLKQHGKPDFVNAQGNLTKQGETALYQLLHGDKGIVPEKAGSKPPFTIKQLIAPYKEMVITQFLPAPKIGNQLNTFTAGHGTHTFGLINAQYSPDNRGITGLAPQAKTLMIKAFQDDGTSTISTLIAGLKKAIDQDADIVNLSLKVANVLDLTQESSKMLDHILGLIPYVVAASGNDGDSASPHYPGIVESYPARFTSIPFDVGAFDANGHIPAFCQYEQGIGPLFMAPGFNILSTGIIPGQQEDSMYVFMDGTSMAAPLISGFLALMLGEFKDIFSRQQLIKTCYLCTIKLAHNADWKTKTILGALDMRMVLFTLHAVRYVQEQFKKSNQVFANDRYFDNLLQAITYMLFALANEYGVRYSFGVLFQQDFMQYQNAAEAQKKHLTEVFIPRGAHALNDALRFVYNTIAIAVGTQAEQAANQQASDAIIKEIARIMKQKELDLFSDFSGAIKKRINAHQNIHLDWNKKRRKH